MTTLAILNIIAETVIRELPNGHPGMLKIIFWLLLIFWAVGAFGFRDNPRIILGTNFVLIILFSILGYCVFGFN